MEETLQQIPTAALIDHYQHNMHTAQSAQWDAVKWTYSGRTEKIKGKNRDQEIGGEVERRAGKN